MAVIYVLTVIALTVGNIDRIPLFFSSVFTQAFAPDAVSAVPSVWRSAKVSSAV